MHKPEPTTERPDLYVQQGIDKHLTEYSPTQSEHKPEDVHVCRVKAGDASRGFPASRLEAAGIGSNDPIKEEDGWIDMVLKWALLSHFRDTANVPRYLFCSTFSAYSSFPNLLKPSLNLRYHPCIHCIKFITLCENNPFYWFSLGETQIFLPFC